MGKKGLYDSFLESQKLANKLAPLVNNFGTIPNSIKPLEVDPIRDYHLADYQYEVIKKTIAEFEESLDEEHEVALKLTSFGQSITLQITELGYSNPALIHFYGFLKDGSKAELIQHISQINFLLLAIKKAVPEKPPRRIGFHCEDSEECSSESEP